MPKKKQQHVTSCEKVFVYVKSSLFSSLSFFPSFFPSFITPMPPPPPPPPPLLPKPSRKESLLSLSTSLQFVLGVGHGQGQAFDKLTLHRGIEGLDVPFLIRWVDTDLLQHNDRLSRPPRVRVDLTYMIKAHLAFRSGCGVDFGQLTSGFSPGFFL